MSSAPASTSATVRQVILGTAGHIDHGKTSLVERLTGVRTDRLKEEQERGMTIDVGYAAFALPDGTEVGLLDVPGHERLVRTMVAAATAMDLALLVVAADDGPMPQTREHVEILDVLGVERLVVALTKVDLVEEAMVEIAREEIEAMLEGTGMQGAPVLPVSSADGRGVDALREAIATALPPPRGEVDRDRVFRMPVLRAFGVQGRGTVVTGIPLAGHLEEGDPVEILPPRWAARVRGIQVHQRDAQAAQAGQRTALALSDVAAERVKRGMVVVAADTLAPTRRLAVRLRLLEDADELAHGDRVRFHVGAEQSIGRIHLLEGQTMAPGTRAIVEVETFDDVVAVPGDRFVMRRENASATLGGGLVVQLLERRLPRRRRGLLDDLAARCERLDDPATLVAAELAARGNEGARLEDVAARTGLVPGAIPPVVDALVARDEAVRLGHDGGLWLHGPAFARVRERVEEGMKRLHARDEALATHPVSAVRTAAGRIPAPVLDAALDGLVADGVLVREDTGGLRHRSHASALSEVDRRTMERVQAALAAGAGQPPAEEDLEADLGLAAPDVRRALRLLANRGTILKAGDAFFDATWVEEAKARLAAHAKEHGGFTPADARTLLDTTRKWVIPLLETLDKLGFSRRVGDRRVLR